MSSKFSSTELLAIDQKENILINRLSSLKGLIVAYSGGVDSSLLAYYANKVLGSKAKICIAVSSSLAQDSLEGANQQASLFGWNLLQIETDETSLKQYQENNGMRCFFCKATLFSALAKKAEDWQIENIAAGTNIQDLGETRPGHMAAKQFKVLSPLVEAGLKKEEIRYLAQRAGLPSWDKPQDACLASRIPTDTLVTVTKLKQVELAEKYLRELGFRQVRVRHFEDRAVVEVGSDQVCLFDQSVLKAKVEERLSSIGFDKVEIDPFGYRTGSVSGSGAPVKVGN